jgi:hypothetical protein
LKRLADWHLKKWKEDPYRKPLIIRGARQIGKTFSVRQFGRQFANFVEINFEKTKEVKSIFEKNLDPHRILMDLKALFKQPINPGSTLLFFDEIQECPDAITSLRYFFEIIPSLHVIAAGSLLDFAIEQVGIPVGRVSSLYLFPLSFMEFLAAMGYSLAANAILQQQKGMPISDTIHSLLLELLGQYLMIGGLPEAVAIWVQTKDPIESQKVHHRIADTYRQDFEKYAKKHQIKYLDALFTQIPSLAGKQFKYNHIHGEYQKRELAPCLELLGKANIIHKVQHSGGNGLPLGAETNIDWFKIIFLDIALCQSILGFDRSTWLLNPREAFVNQGDVIEAFVGQELLCYSMSYTKPNLYFWKRDKRGSQAEIDYLYSFEGNVIPIEAKSTDGNTLKSMQRFLHEHPKSPYGIRFSSLNYSLFGQVDSRPLYAISSIAHEDQQQSLQYLLQERE